MARRDAARATQRFSGRLWFSHPRYRAYMIREATSLFILVYAVVYIIQLLGLSSGPQGYKALIDIMANPWFLAFNLVLLGFSVYHAVTWLSLAGKVQQISLGGRIPGKRAVAAGGVVLWLLVSLLLAIFIYA